jgi:hypothetical protein
LSVDPEAAPPATIVNPEPSPADARLSVTLRAAFPSKLIFPVETPKLPTDTLPAAKSPFASRATMALGLFAAVAEVALLSTFPAVVIVANFESAIAAAPLISASLTSEPLTFPLASVLRTPAAL